MKIRYEKADTIQAFEDLLPGTVFQSVGTFYLATTNENGSNAWNLNDNHFVRFLSDAQVKPVNAELLIK